MTKQYEVNGFKLEVVDNRVATQTSTLRVGDAVRILEKPSYGDPKLHTGIIAGFEPFPSSPTIIVAYVDVNYSSAEIKFVYLNALGNEEESKRFEIIPTVDDDLPLEKGRVVELLDRDITRKEEELSDLKRKKEFFLAKFGQVFEKEIKAA